MTPDTNKRECCEKCDEGQYRDGGGFCYCPCHTEPSVEHPEFCTASVKEPSYMHHEECPCRDTNKRMGGWSEEFDDFFSRYGDKFPQKLQLMVKGFIRSQLSLAHSEGFKEGVAKAVGCVLEKPQSKCWNNYYKGVNAKIYENGFRKSREDMLEALRDLLAQDISSKKE